MMNKNVREFLTGLGLTDEETKIYLTLVEKGVLTTLELARTTSINRTRVYRLLEKLKKMGIVEEVIDAHRKLAKAVSADSLEFLVRDEEEKAKKLRGFLPTVSSFISGNITKIQPGTKVLFYRGKEGVRQQVWNTLRTKGELLGYTYRPLAELIGDYYFKWYEEWVKRKIPMRDLYSDEYVKSKKTYIERQKKILRDSIDLKLDYIQSRYIPSSILNINYQIDIYNEITSFYNWYEGEVFGVEIYNQKVTDMNKQLFEIVWKMAEPK